MAEEFPIIFENEEVVVINKPPGVMVHGDGRTQGLTVVDWLVARVPTARGVGEPQTSLSGVPLDRSGVVHRLDRETSGVLILAKTEAAHAHLKAQFHDRLVQKEYRAFVYGPTKERWGTIDRSIGRSATNFRLRSAQQGARGTLRRATTDWEKIASGSVAGESFSYLKLMPKTGRTHQLRVHLKAIDRPIVGDKLYAPSFVAKSSNLGLERLALHAHVLALTLPDGSHEQFVAPLPETFVAALKRIAEE